LFIFLLEIISLNVRFPISLGWPAGNRSMMCHPIGKAGEKMENQKEKEKEIHFDGKINGG